MLYQLLKQRPGGVKAGGFKAGELVVVSAGTNQGKSMFYPPHQPNYRMYLQRLAAAMNPSQGSPSWMDLESATATMKNLFPGDYALVEKHNIDKGIVELDIKFDCPKKELLWKIKWE